MKKQLSLFISLVALLWIETAPAVTCASGLAANNPDNIYTVNTNGTVIDTRTGLMWKRCTEGNTWNATTNGCSGSPTTNNWSGALTLAESATFAGYSDWRLPNRKELASLVETCRVSPAINDTVFPNTHLSYYWSNSPSRATDAGLNIRAWQIHFNDGQTDDYDRANNNSIRLVRDNTATSSYSLAITRTGDGRITSDPTGIDCGGTGTSCDYSFAANSTVTLTAAVLNGSSFTRWGGACSGIIPSCTVTMSAAQSVTADFTAAPYTLTTSVTGSGAITATGITCGNGGTDCVESYATGTQVTLTAAPATGASFTNWGGACTGTSATCTVTMSAAQSVSATFTATATYALTTIVDGSGKITSSPAGIECGSDCSESFAANTQVTLTAAPLSGALFSGWAGNCGGTTTTCTVNMYTAQSVTAIFVSPTVLVDVTGNGSVTSSPTGITCGGGSTDCSESVAAGTPLTLTAAPSSGATFTGWGGACSGTSTTCVVTANAATTSVTATFATVTTYALTTSVTGSGAVTATGITCGNGGTDCVESYATGTQVTLTAAPVTGASFTSWGGACSGTSTTCVVTMSAAKSVTATFTTAVGPTLMVNLNGNGTVTSSPAGINCGSDCGETYAVGSTQQLTLTAMPAADAVFIGWAGGCTGSEATCVVRIGGVGALGITGVTAIFAAQIPALTVTLDQPDWGRVTADSGLINCPDVCVAGYPTGSQVMLTAQPVSGAAFVGWDGACFGNSLQCVVTMDAAQEVSAQFEPLTLTIEISGAGRVTDDAGHLDCPDGCTFTYPVETTTVLTATPDLGWRLLGWGGACTGMTTCQVTIGGSTAVTANFVEQSNPYQLNSPINGSVESGIGVVDGWVCQATTVSLQVDDFTAFITAYGAERPDSQALCGDTANGFAAAINWADYGDGDHTLTLRVDDQPVAAATVNVVTLGTDYLKGAAAAATVADFPTAGISTNLLWSEPHQNFVVTGSTHPALSASSSAAREATTAPHNWESPLPDGFESGNTLLRGWACEATNVSALLDGSILLPLPYGSEREDTQPVCGDTNNGYALAINWNQFGDGQHQITLNINDVPLETRSFTIATPGGLGVISGIQQTHRLTNFPFAGDLLTLRWSEPHQNFRFSNYQPRAAERSALAWQITEIYIATLGYAPDSEGLQYWVNKLLNDHWTPTSVAQSFFDNELVQARYPLEAGDEALVDALYENIFNRAADPDGKAYWLAQLAAGGTARHVLILAMINGGWANDNAADDMMRFRYLTQIGLAFANAQDERGLIYSALSPAQQAQLRAVGAQVLEGVTTDITTRNAAIANIPALLDSVLAQ